MGSIAALLTSLCWSWTSVFFSTAGKIIGSKVVNRTRLIFAVVLLSITHLIVFKSPVLLNAEVYRWFWLGISAIVGLVLGDAMLFQALVLVGPRIAMLVMSIVPAISAILAWIFLREFLGLFQIVGMSITIMGIMLVVLDRKNGKNSVQSESDNRNHRLGLLLSLGGALGQAGGLILAKKGLDGDFSSLSGVLIRMIIAMFSIWILALLSGEVKSSIRQLMTHPLSLKYIAVGAITGPFIGVWLSLYAVQTTKVGIASTLMALTPIFHLPISRYYLHEEINLRAITGTVLAIAGVAIIFLFPS
jgi:drug/metabolite transporter (DMT)-like permease